MIRWPVERVRGIEPLSSGWKPEVLAVELHPQNGSILLRDCPGSIWHRAVRCELRCPYGTR